MKQYSLMDVFAEVFADMYGINVKRCDAYGTCHTCENTVNAELPAVSSAGKPVCMNCANKAADQAAP